MNLGLQAYTPKLKPRVFEPGSPGLDPQAQTTRLSGYGRSYMALHSEEEASHLHNSFLSFFFFLYFNYNATIIEVILNIGVRVIVINEMAGAKNMNL